MALLLAVGRVLSGLTEAGAWAPQQVPRLLEHTRHRACFLTRHVGVRLSDLPENGFSYS